MKKLIILILALLPLFAVSQITFPNSSKQQGKKLFMDDVKLAKSLQVGANGLQIDSIKLVNGKYVIYKAGVAYDPSFNSSYSLSDLVPLKADSNKTNGTGYATPKYVLDHAVSGGGFADSLSVLVSPPSTGNVYINSTSGRLWIKSNSYWKSPVWASDSVAAVTGTLLNGLLAYYKMDEASGNLTDSKGGFTGTVSGSPTYSATGKINTAVTFAGSSYFNAGNVLKPTAAITISAWVKTTSTGSFGIVSNYYYDGFDLTTQPDGTIAFEINDTYALNSGTNISTGAWFHVVSTFDGSNLKMYINGVSDVTPLSHSGSIPYSGSGNFQIGARLSGNKFTGTIDEVGVWDRALTPTEIALLYNTGSGKAYSTF